MKLTRRGCVTSGLGVVIESLILSAKGSLAFNYLVSEANGPSVVVSLEIVDENNRKIKGAVLIIPDGIRPQDFGPELLRQVSEGTQGVFDSGDEPRTLILTDPPSKYGIGANLPVSVITPNYRTHRINVGPIPSGTSPTKSFRPPMERVKLKQRTSVSIKVIAQPGGEGRFVFDVLVQNDDESAVYLECLRAELRRGSATGGLSAEDRVEDVHIISVDKSGVATSSLRGREISPDVRAFFPYSSNPDPMIIESEFLHEVPQKDNRRYRIDFGVSPDFFRDHGFDQAPRADAWKSSQRSADSRKEDSTERIKKFYRYISVNVSGHFKDDSELSEYNKAENEAKGCDFYVRPAGRFYADGVLEWAQ
ncbi:hypothetical protein [Tunturiibacter gelidoferens]|uniref:Uncharacterized protein n=1 Tax=Tunturiibacter lichenicola TaxID=2051959 RepID=A0A7Y9T6C5_9BACT|nr:hypothetical protein [Edaphobacter lichenicola]NYF53174.1 hypothetical protein [Edaphobacter lichenicola]